MPVGRAVRRTCKSVAIRIRTVGEDSVRRRGLGCIELRLPGVRLGWGGIIGAVTMAEHGPPSGAFGSSILR
jgi:hypothetical protein